MPIRGCANKDRKASSATLFCAWKLPGGWRDENISSRPDSVFDNGLSYEHLSLVGNHLLRRSGMRWSVIRAHPLWMDRKFGLQRFSRSPSQVYASEKSRAGHRKAVSCITHVLFLLQLLRIAKPAALSYGETKIAEVVAGSDTLGRAGDRRGIRHLRSTY